MDKPTQPAKRLYQITRLFTLTLLAALSGCGGGSDSGVTPTPTPTPVPVPTPSPVGVFPPSDTLAKQCIAPRPAGTLDPFNKNQPYADKQGSAISEKAWLRSWVNETYLWYNEVTTYEQAAIYPAPLDFFNVLKTPLITSSSKAKDQFHFTYPTADWVALAQSGTDFGYGFSVELVSPPRTLPRKVLVAYTDPNTPAASAAILRGAEILSVDGGDVVNGASNTFVNGLFPSQAGSHTFVLRDSGAATTRTVTLNATTVTIVPVQNVKTIATSAGNVGYMLFNDHIATAESQLITAINQLKNANVTDLVIDIRYNGGGYLDIASELAYMVAGPANTAGKTFEKLNFNSKNPFNASAADLITPFHSTTQGFSTTPNIALPYLGLNRVFVLTNSGTCSASEAIMNGLRGAGVLVVQIGSTTCGKPYGFFPTDNCSTTYFAIQFQGVNATGFGDYADGFVPGGLGVSGVPGCQVADDFGHPLGDPAEAKLSAALGYLTNPGLCPAPTFAAREFATGVTRVYDDTLQIARSPLRENRFYRNK